MVVVSPPNAQGFVHFGPHYWTKRQYVRAARLAIAEVDASLIAVHGDCYAHVSEFDAFVPFTPPTLTPAEQEALIADLPAERQAAWRDLFPRINPLMLSALSSMVKAVSPQDAAAMLGLAEPPAPYRQMADHLRGLIRDGDCIQIGTGEPGRYMPNLGVFDERQDLGIHTELGSPGYGRLVREGIVTNARKAIHRGKSVGAAWTAMSEDDYAFIDDNPLFELHDPSYVLDLRTLTQIDNYVAINNAVSVDLLGTINAESTFGNFNILNGLGGQPEAHLGGFFSRGGRAITLLPSTAVGGTVSRVVPMLEEGTLVTVPRFFADLIVTEHGVAQLLGKNHRQRAEEMISVAHPDFRADLRREAERLL